MADLDLTEAVEAAARALMSAGSHGITWDELTPISQHGYRSAVAPIVAAAAPILAAQARREALEGLAERLRSVAPGIDGFALGVIDEALR